MPKTILLTNGRSPAGLDLLRSFKKSGHKVYVAESFPVHLCKFSRHGRSLRVPAPRQNPREYIDAIKEIVKKYSVDLIFPIYEEIFILSRFRDEFEGLCEICCDEFSLLKRLHSKYEFMEMCREFGLSHPKSELLYSAGDVECFSDKVLKPVFSRFGTDVHVKPNLDTVRSLDFDEPWVLQDCIEGEEYGVYCMADRGEILALSIYPMDVTLLGVSISYRHEPVDEIIQWVTTFVKKSNVSSNISFDFILKDSVVYPIECNPRVTSGVHLFSDDAEFVRSILEKTPFKSPAYKPAMLGPFVFFKALFKWSLWKTYWRNKDVLFRWSDPLPLLGQSVVIFYLRFLARKYGKPVSEVSTLDIEFNGEHL